MECIRNSSKDGEIQDFNHDFAQTCIHIAKLEAQQLYLLLLLKSGKDVIPETHFNTPPGYVYLTLLLTMAWIDSDLTYGCKAYKCHCTL